MAVDIGPRIGIDGEKTYKTEINNIIAQAKMLSSEMKAVTSSFDKNTTAEEKAAKTSEVLNKQIENQQKRIELLTSKLQESKDKTGENSTETYKWQEAVNKANAELNNMKKKLDETSDGMDENKKDIKDVGDETEEAGKKASVFGDVLKANLTSDAIKKGLEMLKNALKGIGEAFKEISLGSAAYADDIATMSTVTGLSTKSLQEFTYMSELVDTDVSTITGSLTKLTRTMSSAQDGSKTATGAFEKLGVAFKNSDGSLRNNEEVFYDVIEALGNMSNETERDALAMEIFGKSAKELNPLIAAGKDGMEAFRKEAEELGFVLTDEQLEALTKVDDAYQRWQRTIEMVKNTIGVALAPAMESLLTTAKEWVTGIDWSAVGEALGEVMTEIGESLKDVDVTQLLKDITNGIKDLFNEVNKIDFIGLAKSIGNVINLISNHGGKIAAAIGAIGAAFAGLKIASLISSLGGFGAAFAALTGPVGIAIAAIGAIGAVVMNWGTISTKATELWNNAKEAISTAFTNLKESVTNTVEAMKTAVTEKWESLKNGIKNKVTELKDAAVNKFQEMKNGLTEKVEAIKGDVASKFEEIKSKIQEKAEGAKNKFLGAFDEMKNGASTGAGAVNRAIAGISFGHLSGAAGSAYSWGYDMMQNMANGINGGKYLATNASSGVARGISRYLHFSHPDVGPLADFEEWMPDFMAGLASGIKDNAYKVEDAIDNVAGSLAFSSPAANTTNNSFGPVAFNVTINSDTGLDRSVVDNFIQEVDEGLSNLYNQRKAVFG